MTEDKPLPVPRRISENVAQSFTAEYLAAQNRDIALAWHEWLSLMTPAQRNQVKRFCRGRYEGFQPWTVWRRILEAQRRTRDLELVKQAIQTAKDEKGPSTGPVGADP
jgi:hypothetical protein